MELMAFVQNINPWNIIVLPIFLFGLAFPFIVLYFLWRTYNMVSDIHKKVCEEKCEKS
jgi:hypothetical protein